MNIPNLTFESVGRGGPLGFAKALAKARIFERDGRQHTRLRRDLPGLVVSFSKAGFFDAPELATLAAILRRIAEEDKPVTINWPRSSRGQPGDLEKYLERLQFAQLFEKENGVKDWRHRISILGRRELEHYPPDPHETTHYIPFRWFDKNDFLLVGDASIWRERPIVKPAVERGMHSVLLQQGFADIETIDALNRVLFLELAFNAVLHAAGSPGSGSGVFGAQIRHQEKQPPSLTFCIADAGRGIPFTLRAAYDKAVESGEFYPEDSKSVFSNVIRFAFENNSSSRPEFPSGIDEDASRGLALVAESLTGRGELALFSDSAGLRVKGRPEAGVDFQLADDFRNWPLIGTQIIGTLRSRVKAKRLPARKSSISTATRFAVVQCCEPNGYCSVLASENSAKAFLASVNTTESVLIFDLGFGETGIRHLEYLCQNALPRFRDKLLLFWNISTEWNQCESLCRWISENLGENGIPPLFVRDVGDARVFGNLKDKDSSRPSWSRQPFTWYADFLLNNYGPPGNAVPPVGSPVDLSADDYLAISRRVNSELLADGFRRSDTASGYFSGNIHLLSTRNTTKYFAIAANIAAGVDANLKRWVAGSVAGIIKLAGQNQDLARPIVILAFAGPMRQVLAHIPQRLPMRSRGYTLLTYDVPTHEEISSYVHSGDNVVLLTDVVSTGSLLGAVAGSVTESNAKVVGIVCLINYRQDGNAQLDSIKLGRENIPFCGISDFPRTREGDQYSLTDKQYWVDPVTLIPQASRPWGWAEALDSRIENTIALLIESEAVRCGHVVDGSRHTSVYVDVKTLLSADAGGITRQVRSICYQRLEGRDWKEFKPSVILYPTGIRRIEAVELSEPQTMAGGTGELTAYATAAKLFCTRLKEIWGRNIPLGEVPRAFDPGGVARCSEQVLFQEGAEANINWQDVIIADDGMWRGVTSTALIRLAVARGAKRILVIPLLTRMTPKEAETWENICSVDGQAGSPPTSICFALPFILPIPSYSVHECPYEQTQRRFRDREWFSETVRQLAESVSATLTGRYPGDAASHSPSFLRTWLRLRCYAELATENEMALEKLGQLVESVRSEEDLLALFSMFLEEWRLLGKARLRQTIASRVKQQAQQALRANHDGATKAAALSLLRSQFTDDFFPALATIADSALKDPSLLGRAVLHIATLPARERTSDECLRFLDLIQDKGPAAAKNAGLADRELTQYMELVGVCGAMALQSRVHAEVSDLTPRRAANKAIDFITNDADLRHDVRPFVNPFATRGESLGEVSARTFALHAKDWKSRHHDFLTQKLLPLLAVLRPCLLQMSTHKNMNPSHIQYLTSSRPGTRQLAEDFGLITAALQFLAEGQSTRMLIITLAKAAERLSLHLINEDSTLIGLLNALKGPTVGDFVSDYQARITERLKIVLGPAVSPEVTVEGLPNVDATKNLFVPAEELDACSAHILHNLETKAFIRLTRPEIKGEQYAPKVVLVVSETRNSAGELCVLLTVKNNGAELGAGIEMGARGKRIARHIQLFGGSHEGPIAIEEHPWRVVQRLSVCLW